MSMITGHAMDDLLAVVGRERQVLERLLFRVLQAASILSGDETRFLHWMALDLERVTEHLREIDLQRSIVTVGLHDTGASQNRSSHLETMTQIVQLAPTPYQFLLEDHHQAMRSLLEEIGATVAHIRDLVHDRLGTIGSFMPRRLVERFDIGNTNHIGELDPLDREILSAGYGSVLNACDRLQLPELVRFLDL